MADVKISALPAATLPLSGTESVPIVQGGVTKKVAARSLASGPAFSAWLQFTYSFTAGAWTKINFDTEEFDTDGAYDAATNHRFQPTVAGYYQISACATLGAALASEALAVYKNGTIFKQLQNTGVTTTNNACGSTLVYLNGSTDYVEIFVNLGITQVLAAGADSTYFQGVFVRG